MAPRPQRDPAGNLDPGAQDGPDRIPKDRVDAMIAKAKEETARTARAEARAEFETERRREVEAAASAKPPPTADPPKEYSRGDLEVLVAGGKITEAQMDETLSAQQERRISERVDQQVEEKLTASQQKQLLQSEIDLYTEAIPGIAEKGSDDRNRLEAEFATLVTKFGQPSTMATEVMALRKVFGEPKKHERVPGDPSHAAAATGSGADDDDAGGGDGDSAPKWMPKKNADYYEHGINTGKYTGWDDPNLTGDFPYVPGYPGRGQAA